MAFSGRMNGPAIHGCQNGPDRVMQIAGLQDERKAFRVRHSGHVAVISSAYPSRARGVGPKLAWRIAARHGICRRGGQAAAKAFALARKALPVERRILIGAHAGSVMLEGMLMRVDKNHRFSGRISAIP